MNNQLIHSYSYRSQMGQTSVQFEGEPQRWKGWSSNLRTRGLEIKTTFVLTVSKHSIFRKGVQQMISQRHSSIKAADLYVFSVWLCYNCSSCFQSWMTSLSKASNLFICGFIQENIFFIFENWVSSSSDWFWVCYTPERFQVCTTTVGLCGSGNGAQGFLHTPWALY